MAFKTGTSALAPQVLIEGEVGDLNLIYLFIPHIGINRPRRVGYFWHGCADGDGKVSFMFNKGTLTDWGLILPSAISLDPGQNRDALVVEWNQAGIEWTVFY